MRVELKLREVACGEPSVMTSGLMKMLKWFVACWDMGRYDLKTYSWENTFSSTVEFQWLKY